MGEVRKDYILDRWVIVSPKRGQRPHELKKPPIVETGVCFFCPGSENLTPPEIGRVTKNGVWQLRWFENKFAALKPDGDFSFKSDNRFYSFSSAYGYHEVVVETPRHDRQLAQLSVDEVEQVLNVYARRIVELESKPNVAYVNVFKNHGLYGGTSIVHSHSQIMALAFVPPEIGEKISAMRKFISCPYCSIVRSEMNSGRLCFENSDFVAFCPYASRFNYEVWIFPKNHISRLENVNFAGLADVLVRVLKKVFDAGFDYNMFVQYGPKGEDFHFHVEICPRVAIWAGFELCSGVIINSVAPEDAAKFYRGEE
ncbi:MAG: galactose-1-phosphate uridylyltransferase [Candidatus Woesearchaeota archaeon]|nr:galactose-1-phosphate uridylyltransferase [Candidatus Woesearchaeota archaeon]